MADDLFSGNDQNSENTPPKVPEDKNYLEELVGEGKKFKDVQSLAKGKAEADAYITNLLSRVDEMKSELNTRLTLEQFMDKMNQSRQPDGNRESGNDESPVNREEQNQTPNQNGAATIKPEDIERIIDERERKKVADRNVNEVKERLRQTFGDNYVKELDSRASELGIDRAYLNNLASTSPKAFFRLIGERSQDNSNDSASLFGGRTNVNSETLVNKDGRKPGERTASYYAEIKKKNPSLYWSPEIQIAKHKDAMKLGERFFDT